jgi:hypothetical protein
MKIRTIKVVTKERQVIGPVPVSWWTWHCFNRDLNYDYPILTIIDKETKVKTLIPIKQVDTIQYTVEKRPKQ